MTKMLFVNGRFIVPAATAALLMYSAVFDERTPIPTKNYPIKAASTPSKHWWEVQSLNPYYTYDSRYSEDVQHIMTIEAFALKLLQNSKDREPEIVKIVNDNFWNLI